MAYAATVTCTQPRSGHYVLTISETDCAAASETEIDLSDPKGDGSTPRLPSVGRIVSRRSALTAGAGSTLDPILGNATDPANGASWLYEHGTAANPVHDVPASPVYYDQGVTSVFHRSVPDSGTDNAVTTVYYIVEGWE